MTEEKEKPDKKPKEPTLEEIQNNLIKALDFPCRTAETLKRLKDANMLDAQTEMEMKKQLDEHVRQILGLPQKPQPPQPAFQQQYQPPQQNVQSIPPYPPGPPR